MSAIFARRHPELLSEAAGEVVGVVVSNILSDACQRLVAVYQAGGGALQAMAGQILHRRQTKGALELARQVFGRKMGAATQFCQSPRVLWLGFQQRGTGLGGGMKSARDLLRRARRSTRPQTTTGCTRFARCSSARQTLLPSASISSRTRQGQNAVLDPRATPDGAMIRDAPP